MNGLQKAFQRHSRVSVTSIGWNLLEERDIRYRFPCLSERLDLRKSTSDAIILICPWSW